MVDVLGRVFALAREIRYVAIYRDGILVSRQAGGVANASASESDRYEELLVIPALLTLVRQRGDIDCGGARFMVIRYGNFYQLVVPIAGGHVSVCFDLAANPLLFAEAVGDICRIDRD